ncbi:MAG: 4-hydroxybenzoate octaprenyltransferase [Candidatus Cloacimonadota bacterium]|nr:MAG: 4-hydroxybenzoate octaprenyltransferase [Candidatus Cloacimonadota bacterium]PIE78871.1 MAG: 4-hydroxybenzoate octaprenyltransferase [Candidatus Delongbacteria bacterium]
MKDMILKSINNYGRMIKFSHTIFALPFAISSLFIVSRDYEITFMKVFWIVLAMVGARSASMGFNRLVDADIDSENPRTKGREIPSGKISKKEVVIFILFFSFLFIGSAYMLNTLCYYLSYPTLLFLFFYSYTKRFTSYSHYILGASIGISPAGAWLAISGEFTLEPLILIISLGSYIAGFDILYSCQDEEFDRNSELFSIPSKFGREKSLKISSYTHFVTFLLFLLTGIFYNLSQGFFVVSLIIGLLLFVEHKLVSSDDMSKIKIAFLYVNSLISVLFLIGVVLGTLW